jgi:integrase/recombinase XerD
LTATNVELPEGRLTVRRDKNGKSREIALHPSTVIALVAYARVRDQLCRHPKDPSPFLISAAGRRLHRQTVGHEFERLRRWCGLDYDTLGRAARIHDLRTHVRPAHAAELVSRGRGRRGATAAALDVPRALCG